ncbi:MAG: ATP-binding protein [Clostridiales Family XIII bacterium]|jgi:signal transduction histidine kinase|nr:ATP-binding protein [Clostridiales Family XIII bacterium]
MIENTGLLIMKFIQYFTIVICACYIFSRLLQTEIRLRHVLFTLLCAVLLGAASILWMRHSVSVLVIPTITAALIFFHTLLSRDGFRLSATATIIALAISYTLCIVSGFVVSFVYVVNGTAETPVGPDDNILNIVFTAVIEILLVWLIFRIKRLRKGMPFLRKTKSVKNLALFLSAFILIAASFTMTRNETERWILLIATALLIAAVVCVLIIHQWWRYQITKEYRDKVAGIETPGVTETNYRKDLLIAKLEKENKELSQIIHRDNKLIPAMEYAVRDFIKTHDPAPDADKLLSQLEDMAKDRIGIIKTYNTGRKMIQTTNIGAIDVLLFYMYHKAQESGVAFDVMVSNDIAGVCGGKRSTDGLGILPVSDLRTLLADLTDNAINAARAAENKRILIDFRKDEHFRIDIYDSGAPFSKEVLAVMGKQQITTRADDGGSGIGLMTAIEILNKTGGALTIDEFGDRNGLYTKKVSVEF